MSEAAVFQDLVDQICAAGTISAEDVLALRRQVFPDGVVSAEEAEAVFRLDHACRYKAAEWTRFYVDALTDYFVWQSEPRGYVNDAQARTLIDNIEHDGRIDALSELELLLNVVHWCVACPAELSRLALAAVKDSVLSPESAAYGSNRPPAVIAPADVELIRKVIYAPGSPGGFTVTREEAEILFALERATIAEENAPAWPDLFAKGVANALMFPRGAPQVPDAAEALRRERWLEERGSVGNLLLGVGKALASGSVPVRAAFQEADVFGSHRAREAEEQEQARVAEALTREAIDAEEARWLIAQLAKTADSGDGFSEGERQLLAFIKANSPSIDPALQPLIDKAEV
ncbi:MAG: hypothetical protein R3285_06570 [Kiloniellales bacterium]|nr:hypothetical protein [Kiloniellales bacterium]